MKRLKFLLFAILIVVLTAFSACGVKSAFGPAISSYLEGNASFDVSEIDSVCIQMNLGKDGGTVTVSYGEQENITAVGTSNGEEEYLLRYAVEKKTLYIREAKIEEERDASFRQYIDIVLPKGKELKSLVFNSVSAKIKVQDVACKNINLESSGGGVEVVNAVCEKIYTKAYTSDIRVQATVKEYLETYTTYAKSWIQLDSLPTKTYCRTKYGAVDLSFDKDIEGFTVYSGQRTFESDFDLEKVDYVEGSDEKTKYVYGDGEKEITLSLWLKSCKAKIIKRA